MALTIATWNINSIRVRLPHILQWLAANQIDILALQETKILDEDFPIAEIKEAGYEAVYSGQKTYNGVTILSRNTPTSPIMDIEGYEDPQRRILAATVGDVRVVNLYVPNGSEVGSDKFSYKLEWLRNIHQYLERELKEHPKMVVLGDFNIAPNEIDVHDPAAWEGKVLFSEQERSALRQIIDLGLEDCFRLHEQPEKMFSWWDYRMNAFKRNLGLRIDHILASSSLGAKCSRCFIDKLPRAWDRPSDHAPVVAEFST